jgi:hypothetical protein
LKNQAKEVYEATFDALERRCPDHVDADRWQQAVTDTRDFVVQWADKAAALGWRAQDLLGLAALPNGPAPSYRRLSRYDQTGLIWLLQGRPVVTLTRTAAVIKNPTGALTTYRKPNNTAVGR